MMYISDQVHQDAMAHAIEEWPNESIGAVVHGRYMRIKNVHQFPRNGFAIGTGWSKAFSGLATCYIHSHPDGERIPSIRDLQDQIATDKPWVVICLEDRKVVDTFEWGNLDQYAPMVGRVFRYGVHDCFSLARDFHYGLTGNKIPDVPRPWNWWNEGQNLFLDHLMMMSDRVLRVEGPRVGDFGLCQCDSNVINHVIIYTGKDTILHHPSKGISYDQTNLSRHRQVQTLLPYVKHWVHVC